MTFGVALRAAIWIAVIVSAFRFPTLGKRFFRFAERKLSALAAHRWICCVLLGLGVLGIRAVLLPISPMPKPYVIDEIGYLLQADTFASGTLTNPPHPMWQFFEMPYVLQTPTRNTKFPPGQGMVMAVGEMLAGEPWVGVWLSCGLLAFTLCWALQQWFPPGWALFGSVLSLPLCLTSYWMDSYWGGAVAAVGGALVAGAIPHLLRRNGESRHGERRNRRLLYGAIFSLGAFVLMNTRPFEGLLFLLPVSIALLMAKPGTKAWAAIVIVGLLGAAWTGYYNYRVTGSAAKLPYTEYERQYPSAPHFNFVAMPPPVESPHPDFHWIDRWERLQWDKSRSLAFVADRATKLYTTAEQFFGSFVLILPALAFWGVMATNRRQRAVRWSLVSVAIIAATEVVFNEHYVAPFLAALLILVVQGFRHLRVWEYNGLTSGRALARGSLLAMLILWGAREGSRILHHRPVGATPDVVRRREVEESLEQQPGLHLVLVRYTRRLEELQGEWVVNHGDIDNAQVVWAHDMGPEANKRLLDYFKHRTVWTFQPGEDAKLHPYEAPR